MSEEKVTGHIEEIGNGGIRFIFDKPVTLNNDDAMAMKFEISAGNVIGEAYVYRDVQPDSEDPPAWTIEYSNEVGPDDEWFMEWWAVSNGERSFKCASRDDAEWLRDALVNYESLL